MSLSQTESGARSPLLAAFSLCAIACSLFCLQCVIYWLWHVVCSLPFLCSLFIVTVVACYLLRHIVCSLWVVSTECETSSVAAARRDNGLLGNWVRADSRSAYSGNDFLLSILSESLEIILILILHYFLTYFYPVYGFTCTIWWRTSVVVGIKIST